MQSQVLKAVLHGDSALFRDHPELLDALVRVYFHSSSQKYNRTECWGPLKKAAEVKSHITCCFCQLNFLMLVALVYQAETNY